MKAFTLDPKPFTLNLKHHTTYELPILNQHAKLNIPYTLYSVHFTLYPLPFTLYPTPHTIFPIPSTPYPVPYTLYPIPYTLLYPIPYTQNLRHKNIHPKH